MNKNETAGIDLDLEKLEALARAATPGPWHWVNPKNDQPRKSGEWRASLRTVEQFQARASNYTLPKFIVEADEIRDENMDTNADFIAAADPTTVLQLIQLARKATSGSARCPTCNGDDASAPCAYPSQGKAGCLRNSRLNQSVTSDDDMNAVIRRGIETGRQAEASDWAECERIANLPAVDEALRGFIEDPTGNNGTFVVRVVREAGSSVQQASGSDGTAAARDAEEAAKLQTLLMTEFDCYRVAGGGLYAWATNALLDNSPHRMKLTSAALTVPAAGACQPLADERRARGIAGGSCRHPIQDAGREKVSARLTEWFTGDVKPALPGVYETLPSNRPSFQHWDGNQWGFCATSPDSALNGIGAASHYQSPRWHGLAEDPSAAKGEA